MTSVVVVGSINLDLVVRVPRLPHRGETVLGTDAIRSPGGKGANQAVAAARLGAHSVLIGAVGDDAIGTELSRSLAAEKVDVSGLTTVPGVATGLAMIVVDEGGNNTITVAPGANRCLAPPPALPPADVLLLQLEVPASSCSIAARTAHTRGTLVVVNAAPASAVAEAPELLDLADVLVVNETEARTLLERSDGEPPELATALGDGSARGVIVTAGERGAAVAVDGTVVSQAAFSVAAVDSTGAGDAFCGALAVALASGDHLADAAAFAGAAGACATTDFGAQAGLPTAREVAEMLERRR